MIDILDRLVNSNSISGIALAFFIVLVAGVVWLMKHVYQVRTEARSAAESAQIAAKNSQPISNGFAKNVNEKLDHITVTVDDVQKALQSHLEWHLNQRGKNNE